MSTNTSLFPVVVFLTFTSYKKMHASSDYFLTKLSLGTNCQLPQKSQGSDAGKKIVLVLLSRIPLVYNTSLICDFFKNLLTVFVQIFQGFVI